LERVWIVPNRFKRGTQYSGLERDLEIWKFTESGLEHSQSLKMTVVAMTKDPNQVYNDK